MASPTADADADEVTPLVDHSQLHPPAALLYTRRLSHDASSAISSRLSRDELALADNAVGERLPYNAYTTIDWLHDLIKDAFRHRALRARRGLRGAAAAAWDDHQGWLAAVLVGVLTAAVAWFVDNAESTFGDFKLGYCARNFLFGREACCVASGSSSGSRWWSWGTEGGGDDDGECTDWRSWEARLGSDGPGVKPFLVYAAAAWALAVAAGLVTQVTRAEVPNFAAAAAPTASERHGHDGHEGEGHGHHREDGHVRDYGGSSPSDEVHRSGNKVIFMAAGSGIPEIKLLLSGFEFPNLLSFKVLVVKAVGASLAVASGLCLGKEGPFVHISSSAGYVVSKLFPQYRENGRKLRELLSVACSSALAVAFGSPVGGVLFVYEEMSSQFPRKVLWRAFLCSLVSAITLKFLDPNRTGRLVLFETNYGVNYKPSNYVFFVLLGVSGGLFGALFCKGSQLWTKHMRGFIHDHPLLELSGLVLATAALQYPNPITREPALLMIKSLLMDCQHGEGSWICQQEQLRNKSTYYGWLAHGSVVKILLTVLTAGAQIPSGLIVPALGAGSIFGRLVGQFVPGTSPAIFAMVSASAFLAGVSRMTVSLTVIMLELTGEVEFIPPFMIAILTAKVVVDALHEDGINDHTVLGEYLEHEHASRIARDAGGLAADLIPSQHSMRDMTLHVGPEHKVPAVTLAAKLARMRRHGLRDAGLVLVDDHELLYGFLAEAELDFAVHEGGRLGDGDGGPFDVLSGPLAGFVDRTPLTVSAAAPLEMVVEMFYQLGLRHLVVVEEGTSRVVGVVLKQQLIMFLERLRRT